MSVLSDLEKELGLPLFDTSFLNCSSEHIYDGVDFSTPSTSKLLEEQTQDHLLMRMGKPDLVGKPNEKAWLSTNGFDPAKVANKMGIPVTNVSNLFLHILDLHRRTERSDVRNLCEDILKGLYYNTISRTECNNLINKLNRIINV